MLQSRGRIPPMAACLPFLEPLYHVLNIVWTSYDQTDWDNVGVMTDLFSLYLTHTCVRTVGLSSFAVVFQVEGRSLIWRGSSEKRCEKAMRWVSDACSAGIA